MNGIVVLIFAKYPESGRVKTRMVPPLSTEQAAAVHAASLSVVCALVQGVTENVVLAVTPDESVEAFGTLCGDFPTCMIPQGSGTLGDRLERVVGRTFDEGADGVVLLGADSPTLPPAYLRDALRLVPHHDVVMGPCEDGGYYLLGLRKPSSILFQRIDWGTEHVAAQTRTGALDAGLDLVELQIWYDLDCYESLARAAVDLQWSAAEHHATKKALYDLITSFVKDSSMTDLASMPFSSLLDAIGQRNPSPGGGAVAAAAGALASAMARMVTAYSIKKSTPESVRPEYQTVLDRFTRADLLMRALMTQDAQAYEAMTAASAARKDDDPSSQTAYKETVLQAIGVPMEISALATDSLQTMQQFKEKANRFLVSDLGVAAVLAFATVQAAACSVRINLKELSEGAIREKIATDMKVTLTRARHMFDDLEAYVRGILE